MIPIATTVPSTPALQSSLYKVPQMQHPRYDLPRILAEGVDGLSFVRRRVEYDYYRGPRLQIVLRARCGTYLEATFHPGHGRNGYISLRAAQTVNDIDLARQPFFWNHALHLGSLDADLSDAAPFATCSWGKTPLAGWLEDERAPAERLIAALEDALGPKAQARADAIVALGKAIAMREGVEEGTLRPFLQSGPRFRIEGKSSRRPRPRLVGVFRASVKGAGRPPNLKAFAGRARLWRTGRYHSDNQPILSSLDYLDVRIEAHESHHERLAWRFRAIEAFAHEGYDITPWLFA